MKIWADSWIPEVFLISGPPDRISKNSPVDPNRIIKEGCMQIDFFYLTHHLIPRRGLLFFLLSFHILARVLTISTSISHSVCCSRHYSRTSFRDGARVKCADVRRRTLVRGETNEAVPRFCRHRPLDPFGLLLFLFRRPTLCAILVGGANPLRLSHDCLRRISLLYDWNQSHSGVDWRSRLFARSRTQVGPLTEFLFPMADAAS